MTIGEDSSGTKCNGLYMQLGRRFFSKMTVKKKLSDTILNNEFVTAINV